MDGSKILRPKKWGRLNQVLFSESFNKELGRYRSPYAFRGASKFSYDLKTSIQRLGHSTENLPKIEKALLRNFIKYAHRHKIDSKWQWLSMAQHFGLPTRLLDWTYSPYVALHFATSNMSHMKEDGIVWCVNIEKAHKLLPSELNDSLKKDDSWVFTLDMLDNKLPDPNSWGLKDKNNEAFVLFFEPPSMDDRIVNQVALFSVMSDVNSILDQWLEKNPKIFKKIAVLSDLKWEIRDKLDQSNINERVLFPGLDGLSDWLRRWYSPKL